MQLLPHPELKRGGGVRTHRKEELSWEGGGNIWKTKVALLGRKVSQVESSLWWKFNIWTSNNTHVMKPQQNYGHQSSGDTSWGSFPPRPCQTSLCLFGLVLICTLSDKTIIISIALFPEHCYSSYYWNYRVNGNPEFVASCSEVQVVRGPQTLQLGSEWGQT